MRERGKLKSTRTESKRKTVTAVSSRDRGCVDRESLEIRVRDLSFAFELPDEMQ